MEDEFIRFLEELSVTVGMVARYGGVLTIYTDGTDVKVLYAKNKDMFKKVENTVFDSAVWLNEELLTEEMLKYAENIKKDGEQ